MSKGEGRQPKRSSSFLQSLPAEKSYIYKRLYVRKPASPKDIHPGNKNAAKGGCVRRTRAWRENAQETHQKLPGPDPDVWARDIYLEVNPFLSWLVSTCLHLFSGGCVNFFVSLFPCHFWAGVCSIWFPLEHFMMSVCPKFKWTCNKGVNFDNKRIEKNSNFFKRIDENFDKWAPNDSFI